jgi:hypothetical protein
MRELVLEEVLSEPEPELEAELEAGLLPRKKKTASSSSTEWEWEEMSRVLKSKKLPIFMTQTIFSMISPSKRTV